MNKVGVVSAFVPLNVLHGSAEKYHALAERLKTACAKHEIVIFDPYKFEDCWLADHVSLPPADVVPAGRYPTPRDNVMSNIVQHQRTTWALMAAAEKPDVDVWVWLDFGVLKQGDWTGRPVTEEHIASFLDRIAAADLSDNIPFPAIWGKGPIADHGVNWRFVGSTHIWPTKYLKDIDLAYKTEAIKFLNRVGAMPNDLPIWAHVEETGTLPFRSYSANHDNTQFVNFRGMPPQTALCEIAYKHQTDKGEHHGYTPHYDVALYTDRTLVQNVLEVGIGYASHGQPVYWPFGASLRMWEEYFPFANIYGMDISPEVLINEGRIKSYLTDQSKACALMDTMYSLPRTLFDLIVDDGSHVLEHQVLTANLYLPFLLPGGWYFIEDVNENPANVISRLPPYTKGWHVEVHKSRAEPAHAYTIMVYHP